MRRLSDKNENHKTLGLSIPILRILRGKAL